MTNPNRLFLPADYHSPLNLRQTEIAIKLVKDIFEHELASALNLTRVSAPLFVRPSSGLNDNLSGVERPVFFDLKEPTQEGLEIVQSLAKWKRLALKRYGFMEGEGLYTDMNAIRRDEDLDNTHSIYVDQWDWEKIIAPHERTLHQLQTTVETLFQVLKRTEAEVHRSYPMLKPTLPQNILFISAQDLEDRYPKLSPKAREDAICEAHGAVFIWGIGYPLSSGQAHDGRAPDYDDWHLNGDILVYHPVLKKAFELSSMGIRVDAQRLQEQLHFAGQEARAHLPFHQALLANQLPQTMGGGIGQSRLCMYFLQKAHIGEVQASDWSQAVESMCDKHGIQLL